MWEESNKKHIHTFSFWTVHANTAILFPVCSVPQGLEDVSSYPNLFAELIATGKWSVDDLKKLAGLNFLRVLQEVEKVRDEFKKAKVLPYEDVLHPKPKDNNCSSQDKV